MAVPEPVRPPPPFPEPVLSRRLCRVAHLPPARDYRRKYNWLRRRRPGPRSPAAGLGQRQTARHRQQVPESGPIDAGETDQDDRILRVEIGDVIRLGGILQEPLPFFDG